MSARVLEGPAVADALDKRTSKHVDELKERGIQPKLAIFRVGERADDISYERGAIKRAEKVGIGVRKLSFPESVTTEALVEAVERVNADDAIHGLLILRPLPAHIDEQLVCDTLDPSKDIDACSEKSLARLFMGQSAFAPCTAQASIEILDHYGIDPAGKHAVVIGRSLVIGKPVAMMLLDRNATVTIAHSRTEELEAHSKQAQILIVCVGRARMVDAAHATAGQTVIDVGINVTDEGQLVGDVAFDELVEIVDAITPVPRGVGSVTTSVLCKHVAQAAEAEMK